LELQAARNRRPGKSGYYGVYPSNRNFIAQIMIKVLAHLNVFGIVVRGMPDLSTAN
jgi:hypothetical protein